MVRSANMRAALTPRFPEPMNNLLMIKATGPDRPGITAALTALLARHDVTVLDIGQAVIHRMLSLGILVGFAGDAGPLVRDLLYAGHELGVQVSFDPVEPDSYRDWVGRQGQPRWIVTVLGRPLGADALAQVTGALAAQGLNIVDIMRLSGRVPLEHPQDLPYACVQFTVRGEPANADALRRGFLELSSSHGVDVAFQRDDIYRRNRRLVAFDMDSTLIQVEVIDQLAAAHGVGEQVAAITERAMRGELDFAESFRERLGLLAGLDASVVGRIAEALPLTEGAERLFRTLNALGYKTAIISGGFRYFAEHLQRKLGVDFICANELDIADGCVTGRVRGTIVDAARKAEFLRELASAEGIDLRQVIAVGDGANDLPMLSVAGLGIAFRAKPIVRERAGNALSLAGLDGSLSLIGVRDRAGVGAATAAN